jgi:hypothetical protein
MHRRRVRATYLWRYGVGVHCQQRLLQPQLQCRQLRRGADVLSGRNGLHELELVLQLVLHERPLRGAGPKLRAGRYLVQHCRPMLQPSVHERQVRDRLPDVRAERCQLPKLRQLLLARLRRGQVWRHRHHGW